MGTEPILTVGKRLHLVPETFLCVCVMLYEGTPELRFIRYLLVPMLPCRPIVRPQSALRDLSVGIGRDTEHLLLPLVSAAACQS